MMLTPKQNTVALRIAHDLEVTRARKILTLHQAGNPTLALFRISAGNKYVRMIEANVTGKPLPASILKWLDTWKNDSGKIGAAINDLYHAIERANVPFNHSEDLK